jgi:hypothetical protein
VTRPAAQGAAEPARLLHLPDAPDAEGRPRIALTVFRPSASCRPALVVLPTIAAALDALRRLEACR